jgi:hypothetical protein
MSARCNPHRAVRSQRQTRERPKGSLSRNSASRAGMRSPGEKSLAACENLFKCGRMPIPIFHYLQARAEYGNLK